VRLTIAQFTFGLQLAGQERVVVDLARAFNKKGYKSLVCTTMFGGELVQELELSNIPFQSLYLKKSYDPRALIPVMRYLKNNRVDVVITHGTSGSLIPRIAAIFSKIPVFINVEHTISDHKNSYLIFINKILSSFTDKIICVSEQARQSLLKIEKTKLDKVLVIHNGLDTSRFSSVKETDKKENDKRKRVGIVASFSEVKGHVYFVEAAAKIVKFYKNVEFIFVGDGNLRPKIEQKVSEYGLDTYTRFLGVRSDVGDLLQTFDVFVLSSLWEGLPISLLEAQYFGVASVVTNVGGIPEVIENEYNGLLVPPRNPDAMASAILRVLNDDKLRNNLGSHGSEIFTQKFSIEKMSNAYLYLIYDILSSKRQKEKSSE
jgi:glycosyltransferase involved in cell wall biosynthesis